MGGQGSSQNPDKLRTSSSGKLNGQLADFFAKVVPDGSDIVTRDLFIDYFPEDGRTLAHRLFTYVGSSLPDLPKKQCSDRLTKIMVEGSTSNLNRLYLDMFCGNGRFSHQGVLELVGSALTLFLTTAGVASDRSDTDSTVLSQLVDVLTSLGQTSAAAEWIDENCPELLVGLHRWLVGRLHGGGNYSSVPSDVFHSRLLCKAWWWILQSALPDVFTSSVRKKTEKADPGIETGTWSLLYNSQDHGLSTNRLQHHVFGYRGPTVMIVSCEQAYTYAVAVDAEWREGTQSWGGSSCCVLRLSPTVRRLEDGENMIQFNDRSRNIPRGLAVGRDSKKRVLYLKEGLEWVEHGQLSGTVHSIEVWGCGNPDLRTDQAKMKKMEMKDMQKAAKVKLPGQWDDSPDKLLLEWGGVKVNHGEQFTRD